jgi:hypothetical protein
MRARLTAILLGMGSLLAPSAFADCVDFSAARAAKAGAELERAPPSAAQLGIPNLNGLKLDGPATTGDPKCGGPNPPITYIYTTTTDMTVRDLLTAYNPNIKPYIEEDGMKRKWYRNPYWSKGMFQLTSNTEINVRADSAGKISRITVTPGVPVLPVTAASQPYSIDDMIASTPWPGGPDGRREFVRADGEAVAQAANSPSPAATGGANPAPASTNCPASSGASANGAGAAVGAEIGGRVLGGGFGRNLGGTLGGVLGGSKPKQAPAADPNCP